MPPKQQPNKKTTEKIKTKIIEDKTFGLKNKKGAKQQKFIQQVQKQVQNKFQGQQKNPKELVLKLHISIIFPSIYKPFICFLSLVGRAEKEKGRRTETERRNRRSI